MCWFYRDMWWPKCAWTARLLLLSQAITSLHMPTTLNRDTHVLLWTWTNLSLRLGQYQAKLIAFYLGECRFFKLCILKCKSIKELHCIGNRLLSFQKDIDLGTIKESIIKFYWDTKLQDKIYIIIDALTSLTDWLTFQKILRYFHKYWRLENLHPHWSRLKWSDVLQWKVGQADKKMVRKEFSHDMNYPPFCIPS